MQTLDLTFPSPEENLAADEACLDLCDEGEGPEVLRFWEPQQTFVVVGYANQVGREVNVAYCRAQGIPVRRRCSGGGTVLQGPGCLNYSVILHFEEVGPLGSISAANRYILARNQAALEPLLGRPVEVRGHTDLALGGLKFSGNAQRRKRQSLLFHGSLLLQADLALIERTLPMPSKEPDYRGHRAHGEFLVNLGLPADRIKAALRQAWGANDLLTAVPAERIDRLVREKYGTREWNEKF